MKSDPKLHTYVIKYDSVKEKYRCRIQGTNHHHTVGIGWGNNPEAALASATIDRNYRMSRHGEE